MNSKIGPEYRGPLPNIRDDAHKDHLGEWLNSRNETSHQAVGLDPGQHVNFVDDAGESRGAVVLGEEHDNHSGENDVYIAANDAHGSGTYKLTFAPDEARSQVVRRAKRVHE